MLPNRETFQPSTNTYLSLRNNRPIDCASTLPNKRLTFWRLPVNLYSQIDADPIDRSEREEADVTKYT